MPTVFLALNAKEEVHQDRVFQCNRCVFSAVAARDVVRTADFQLRVVPARMYDDTWSVDVYICEKALPAFFGVADDDLLKKHLQEGKSLDVVRDRFNVGGVAQADPGLEGSCGKALSKKCIVEVGPTPIETSVSCTVLSALIGLREVQGDLVLPEPLTHLRNEPLLGMCPSRGD